MEGRGRCGRAVRADTAGRCLGYTAPGASGRREPGTPTLENGAIAVELVTAIASMARMPPWLLVVAPASAVASVVWLAAPRYRRTTAGFLILLSQSRCD
jgi:hypothetical protein